MAPMLSLNSPTFFVCTSIVYGINSVVLFIVYALDLRNQTRKIRVSVLGMSRFGLEPVTSTYRLCIWFQ
jgi:hypothetical protein